MTTLLLTARKARGKALYAGLYAALVLGSLPLPVAAEFNHGLRDGALSARGIDQAGPGIFEDGGIFSTISNFLLFLLGAVAVIMLIIGGFKYVLSGGDSTKVEGAKSTIIYAIVGIVVAFLAWAAVDFVINALQTQNQ